MEIKPCIPYKIIRGAADDHENYKYSWRSFTLFANYQGNIFEHIFLSEEVTLYFFDANIYEKKYIPQMNYSENRFYHKYVWSKHYFYKDALLNTHLSHNRIPITIEFPNYDWKIDVLMYFDPDKTFICRMPDDKLFEDKFIEASFDFIKLLRHYYLASRYMVNEPIQSFRYKNDKQIFTTAACHN